MTAEAPAAATVVSCPDCHAEPGDPCVSGLGGGTIHAARDERAQITATLQHGTCALCSRPMVRYTLHGETIVVHPDVDDAAACPPMANPAHDWHTYSAQVNAGLSPGRPGVEHFQLREDRDA